MTEDSIVIGTALISVTEKSGLQTFVEGLRKLNPNLKLIASGGTAKQLEKWGVSYTPLSHYTGFPECLGGRVKTLHPKIAGGILLRRGIDDNEARELGISPIDLVVCNLYDFASASKNPGISTEALIESIDIGGSTLIRAACKNYASVAVVVDPADYASVLDELQGNKGNLTLATRKRLAAKALNASADYESLLAAEMSKRLMGEVSHRPLLSQGKKLRYGENPDQHAWVYRFDGEGGIAAAQVLGGKELSYNNYDDATIAYMAVRELVPLGTAHGVAIVKHGGLSGYAAGPSQRETFRKAWEGDDKSAFGSVIALTSPVTDVLVEEIKDKFIEVMIAPAFSDAFVAWVKAAKPNLRMMQVPAGSSGGLLYKNISGGMLVQTCKGRVDPSAIEQLMGRTRSEANGGAGIATKLRPSASQKNLFAFGIASVKYAKSNAVAIVREIEPGFYQLLGMGAGQPNRVDSLQRLAIPKAVDNLSKEKCDIKAILAKCVLVSDGFFPFDDSVRFAAQQGLKYCVQPGGSTRDKEVIATADALGLCMLFTGERYFSH